MALSDDMSANYVKMPELFDYNQPRIEEYHSPREWKGTDKALEGVFLALLAADRAQTLQASKRRDLEEANPILGLHPSKGKINGYFGAAALAHMGLAHLLPEPYRNLFQGVTIGIEQQPVRNNYKLGLDAIRW